MTHLTYTQDIQAQDLAAIAYYQTIQAELRQNYVTGRFTRADMEQLRFIEAATDWLWLKYLRQARDSRWAASRLVGAAGLAQIAHKGRYRGGN